jgi:hypothetical protein
MTSLDLQRRVRRRTVKQAILQRSVRFGRSMRPLGVVRMRQEDDVRGAGVNLIRSPQSKFDKRLT